MAGRNFSITTARIEAFSDGVFAIVITLLAFQFRLPKYSTNGGLEQNFREMLLVMPTLVGFIFAFFFVAVFWVNHHQMYQSIKEANSKLLWYNMHLLFWITMIPFPVAMIGEHHKLPIAAITMGMVLLMCSVAALVLRRYSYFKAKLVDKELSDASLRDGLNKHLVAIVLNVAAIFLSLQSVYIAYAIYFTVLVLFIIPQKLERKRTFIKKTQQ